MTTSLQPIMIIDDSDDDFETTERALLRDGILHNPILRFENGSDALAYLRREGGYSNEALSPRPGLILLDLNMPGISGREVLVAIKKDPQIMEIPVLVLTTSNDELDIDTCYSAGANTYIQKPVNIDNFFQAIQRLKTYWLEVALLPRAD